MLGTLRPLAASLALLCAAPAFAVEFNYTWKKGDTHRFLYEEDTSMEMSMGNVPGMGAMAGMPAMPAMGGANVRVRLQSVFSQKVLAVRPDGTADVELTVERLDFFQGDKKLAALAKLPPAARVVKAEVDRKGKARFFDMVTVYMQDEQVYVGVHKVKAGPNSVSSSASARVGDEQVELVAAVDPKTGRVTAAANVKKIPPALKKVQIREDATKVEVLPKQIFEMLVLPEGEIEPGGKVSMSMPFGNYVVTLDELKDPVARLRQKLDGQRMEVTAPTETGSAATEGTEGMGEDSDSMGMGSMDRAMGGQIGPAGGTPVGGMKMDADITYQFDVAAGRLLGIQGTTASDMSAAGMSGVKVNSRIRLERQR
jgi:hypothetical protein